VRPRTAVEEYSVEVDREDAAEMDAPDHDALDLDASDYEAGGAA